MEWKYTNSPEKKKVPGVVVSKEGHADSLLGHGRTNYYWLPWKGATVNIASYFQLLRQYSPYLLKFSPIRKQLHPSFITEFGLDQLNPAFKCLFVNADFLLLLPGIGMMARVFTNGPEDLGSIPGRVIPKTQKCYLMSHCLTLGIIRYGSKVKWNSSGKGVAPSPTPWWSSYRKGSLWVTIDYGRQHTLLQFMFSKDVPSGIYWLQIGQIAFIHHLLCSLFWLNWSISVLSCTAAFKSDHNDQSERLPMPWNFPRNFAMMGF